MNSAPHCPRRLVALSFAILRQTVCLLLVCSVGRAFAADAPWAFPDAPLRAAFKAKTKPTIPDAGMVLELPELGVTMANMADIILTDANGKPQPFVKLQRTEADKVLLVAPIIADNDEVHVYYGGNKPRGGVVWPQAKPSLWVEIRRSNGSIKLDELNQVEAAWKNAKEVDGAGLVQTISQPGNPFGECANFLSHFSGYLKSDEKKLTLYTISSDASFVLANGHLELEWGGKHSASITESAVHRGDVTPTGGLVKIDYFHAKDGGGDSIAMLGWVKGGKLAEIPADAWVHSGETKLERLETPGGWPVPVVEVHVQSYIGYGNQWLYEVHCELKGDLPSGWKGRWEWADGSVLEGNQCQRIIVGAGGTRVTVHLTDGKNDSAGTQVVRIPSQPPHEASINNDGDVNRYLMIMEREDPSKLALPTLAGHMVIVGEFAGDELLARYGAAYTQKNNNPADQFWIVSQLARIRNLSQSNPQAAAAEMHKFDMNARKKYAEQLGMLELDILVFGLKSPEAVQVAQRVGFEAPKPEVQRLAKIRIGDLYRLQGKVKEARAQYESVQKTVEDTSGGKKLPAMDRAYSVTINGLIDQGERHIAEDKLGEWEVEHPVAKYDSDFLLLRGRVLMMFARWNEALQELESFRTINPDNPFQIQTDFYRAKAMSKLGKKDEAKKIWKDLAEQYPKHELAKEALKLSK